MFPFSRQSKPDSSFNSAIYEGSVRHRRNLPKLHEFDFRFFMLMIDLDEIDQVFEGRWFWSARRWALCRFKTRNHLKQFLPSDSSQTSGETQSIDKATTEASEKSSSLKQRAIIALRAHGVREQVGAIRVLTQLSYFGFSANPVSFYYCYDLSGESLVAVIAEVNNTPWGEQHLYVVPAGAFDSQKTSTLRSEEVKKAFHVSPFMSLDMNYRMAFSPPGEKLAAKIENHCLPDAADLETRNSEGNSDAPQAADRSELSKKDLKIIDVTLALERKELTTSNLNWLLVKYPAISFQVFLGIYWNALLLYFKKIRFFPHPDRSKSAKREDRNGETSALADVAVQSDKTAAPAEKNQEPDTQEVLAG